MNPKQLSPLELTILKKRKEKNSGIGGIYKFIRRQSAYHLIGDIPLLMAVVNTFREHRIRFSKGEIYRAFKFISPSDYDPKDKHQILQSLFK